VCGGRAGVGARYHHIYPKIAEEHHRWPWSGRHGRSAFLVINGDQTPVKVEGVWFGLHSEFVNACISNVRKKVRLFVNTSTVYKVPPAAVSKVQKVFTPVSAMCLFQKYKILTSLRPRFKPSWWKMSGKGPRFWLSSDMFEVPVFAQLCWQVRKSCFLPVLHHSCLAARSMILKCQADIASFLCILWSLLLFDKPDLWMLLSPVSVSEASLKLHINGSNRHCTAPSKDDRAPSVPALIP
jgi:hypothetical protein